MTATATAQKTLRVIPCRVGGHRLAIDLAAVHSLNSHEPMQPNEDGTPLVGHLPSRGGPLPVYDLAELLGLERTRLAESPRIALFRGEKQPWGLLLERVYSAVEIPARRIGPIPAPFRESAGSFRCVLGQDEEWLPLLAPERIDPDASFGAGPTDGDWISDCAERNAAEFRNSLPAAPARANRLIVVRCRDFDAETRPVGLGISMANVREVREFPAVFPLPGSPDYLLGLTAWRGSALPVFDPARRLGLESPPPDSRSRLLVLHAGDRLAGLLVRNEIEAVRLPIPHSASARELAVDSEFVHSVVELRESTVILPKLDRLLD